MALIVQKFGGTSVASPDRIRAAAGRVARARAGGDRVVVVISAMGDTTDHLLSLAGAVAPRSAHSRRREVDQLLATGEQAASALVALALEERGVPAISLTGIQAGILTDGSHSVARIRRIRARRLGAEVRQGRVPVVAGFQGQSRGLEVTTLGRGGSDTTGVALAVAMGADRCDIYTDVDGIYSADPRTVPGARRHHRLRHREALLLTLAGAAVLHPRAAALAAEHRLPLRVLSSAEPVDHEHGTLIEGDAVMEGPRILGVAEAVDSARLRLERFTDGVSATAGVLSALAAADIPVEHLDHGRLPDGTPRLDIIVPGERTDEARAAVGELLGDGVRVDVSTVARVTVVGTGLSSCGAPLGLALQQLAEDGIEPDALGFSDLGLTLYLPPDHAARASVILHDALLGDLFDAAVKPEPRRRSA
ncbi:MAG TPA: aspartate kinase [Longimicrobiales bacterium]|nr:aspartate kinase [Longimicrobiales bacterium]